MKAPSLGDRVRITRGKWRGITGRVIEAARTIHDWHILTVRIETCTRLDEDFELCSAAVSGYFETIPEEGEGF